MRSMSEGPRFVLRAACLGGVVALFLWFGVLSGALEGIVGSFPWILIALCPPIIVFAMAFGSAWAKPADLAVGTTVLVLVNALIYAGVAALIRLGRWVVWRTRGR